MEQFEKGEIVWVASSCIDWGNKRYRKYVVDHNGHHYCESENDPGELYPWLLMRKLTENKPSHYTQDTFPKGEVWIRGDNSCEYLITQVTIMSVRAPSISPTTFTKLKAYEISEDGRRTWRKAVPKSE